MHEGAALLDKAAPMHDTTKSFDEDEKEGSRRETFRYLLFFATETLGFIAAFLVIYWTAYQLGGFAWDGTKSQFNWHPVLMVIAFSFLFGNSIIVFRIFHFLNKMTLKIIHTVIHLISAVCIIVALIAVVDQHNRAKLPNMYSLHSWAGIASIAMFFVQIIIGTVAFLTPIVPVYFKAYLMPIHRFVGTANFAMAVVAIISGITEKLIFMGAAEYGRLPSYAVMGNFLGITVILYSVGVAILVIYPDFKRVEKNK